MKLLILLTVAACFQVSAKGFGQTISLSLKDAPLETAFKEIKKQSGFSFIYTRVQLKKTQLVTINIKNADIMEVLELCFRNQPISFVIEDYYVVIVTKHTVAEKSAHDSTTINVRGQIFIENGEPAAGATIEVRGTNKAIAADNNGDFILRNISPKDVLIISGVGIESSEVEVAGREFIQIIVRLKIETLDETVVIGYGKTTKRLNTGSIGKITSEEISKQPVTNPLAALYGRVPGLQITQSTGVPGGKFNIQIRGRNSIAQGSEPLIIIDGVPFAPNNNNLNQLTSALASFPGQGLSPLNSLNQGDIESVEVLKDADATAIYGSRGSNGVILITTKKGIAGKTNVRVNLASGFSRVTRTANMMKTKEYLGLRREAFQNDGISPDIFSAPDLLAWDTSRYSDFKNIFIGGTANSLDAHTSVSGGNVNTRFLLRGSYHYETTVFPGDFNDRKISMHASVNHASMDKRFMLHFSGNYNWDKNILPLSDYSSFQTLTPNLPEFYDTLGKLNWESGGVAFDNPMAYVSQKYTVRTDNLLSNLQLEYLLLKRLTVKLNSGFNTTTVDESSTFPKASQNPQYSPTGSAIFGNNRYKSWIIEPQAEYLRSVKKGKLTVLLGGTWQQMINKRQAIQASGYTNDQMLTSVAGAISTNVTDGSTQYRYQAIFGRINYNLNDRYIVNLTGRRDGSSRFGPKTRYANFFAGGAAWLFYHESFFYQKLRFLSFGKVRASYGSTGNDQIGDYQYLDVWSTIPYRYQTSGLIPSRLFNPNYSWEINKKFEAALDLGFMKDRILFSAAYFLNRSSNQLVNYRLPGQVGFSSIIKNLPAIVRNSGLEFSLTSKNILTKKFKWVSTANVTIPRNKLVAFPDLGTSSYAKSYAIGKPLNIVYGYHFIGVDPVTGVYQFEDMNRDGAIGLDDYMVSYSLDPRYYGALLNTIEYRQWNMTIFFEFKKQIGYNYNNYPIYNFTPGGMYNLPKKFNDRWQKPGDVSSIQQLTQTFTPAFDGQYYFSSSDGRFGDASYIRLKNVALSYDLPQHLLKRMKLQKFRTYILCQNLLTITSYKGGDPETQNLFILPPLRTMVAGFQLTF